VVIEINEGQSLPMSIYTLFRSPKTEKFGLVGYFFVGATLQRRFKGRLISNQLTPAFTFQTEQVLNYKISNIVFYIDLLPSKNVLQKCGDNLKAGLHPILLIPSEQETKARVLAQVEGIDQDVTITSIENFIAMNIIELAMDENKDFFTVLKEIVEIYNSRLSAVETDLSLQIEVR